MSPSAVLRPGVEAARVDEGRHDAGGESSAPQPLGRLRHVDSDRLSKLVERFDEQAEVNRRGSLGASRLF